MSNKPLVDIETSLGRIRVELNPEKAPISVANFLQYVKDGFYEGTLFHRVIKGFMVQAGGFLPPLQQKPATHGEIQNEANNGLTNDKYTLAMARTQVPHSASSQFFINVADNGFLNHTAPTPKGWGYAVFGKVVEGTDVVDKIVQVKTGRAGFHDDVPVEAVLIVSAKLVEVNDPLPAESNAAPAA